MFVINSLTSIALGGLLAYAAPPAGPIDSGHHVSVTDDEGLVVVTQWLGAGPGVEFALALPLPPSASVAGAAALRDDDGTIVGVVAAGHDAAFEVRLPLQEAQRLGAVPLAVPLAAGTHRVTFDRALSFEPAIDLGLSQRMTRAATPGVRAHPRRWLDPRLADLPAAPGVSRYTTTEDLVRAGGFVGELERSQTRRRRLLMWAGAGFLLVAAALAGAYRRLRRGAELEHAEAVLAGEIDALGS